MKSYEIEICGVKRVLPFVKINDKLAFASFVIISDTELISAVAGELADRIGPVDAIVTPEAKGIALAYEISRRLGLKEFIVARKSIKSYMKDYVCEEVHSITTKGAQHLYLDSGEAAKIRGRRVCILDDVISTGESLRAVDGLVRKAGAEVACRAAVLAEGEAADRKDIVYLKKLPLFSIDPAGDYRPIP